MDLSISVIFGYDSKQISTAQKKTSYVHLHSLTSVNVVVQWLQIIQKSDYFNTATNFPPAKIIWGTRDKLVNIPALVEIFPKGTEQKKMVDYEHIDLLWGRRACDVFAAILNYLDDYRSLAQEPCPQVPENINS